MNDKRKEYLKKWREDNKEHIKNYKKEYAKTHDSSFKKLQDKYKQLQQENQELKKQVEENKDNYNCLLKQKEQFEYIMSKQVDYQGQQKEFIKYLEDMLDGENDIFSVVRVKDVLQKYREIIGVSDEKES